MPNHEQYQNDFFSQNYDHLVVESKDTFSVLTAERQDFLTRPSKKGWSGYVQFWKSGSGKYLVIALTLKSTLTWSDSIH